jgi:hypothetical protein
MANRIHVCQKIEYREIVITGFLAILPVFSSSMASTADDVRGLTGDTETRIVFSRHVRCEGGANQNYFQRPGWLSHLYYYDTKTDTEKQICPGGDCSEKNYARPLFVSDAYRVVYTIGVEEKVFLTDITGENPQNIASGYCSCVRTIVGKTWAYVCTRDTTAGIEDTVIYRYNLDAPSEREKVYDKRPVGGTNPADFLSDFFQVSADGKRASDNVPWPTVGVINLEDGSVDTVINGGGCNPSMSPDNSYAWFFFTGLHNAISWYFPGMVLCVNDMNPPAPFVPYHCTIETYTELTGPTSGKEVAQPKFTNRPDFITMIGPGDYDPQKPIENVNIFLVKIGSNHKMDGFVKITNTVKSNFWADAFIGYPSNGEATNTVRGEDPRGNTLLSQPLSIAAAGGQIVVRFQETCVISVYDMNGRQVLNVSKHGPSSFAIQMSLFPPGTYMIRAISPSAGTSFMHAVF